MDTTMEDRLTLIELRLLAVEQNDEALIALIGDRNRLAKSAEALRPTVEGLTELFSQVKSNQERLEQTDNKVTSLHDTRKKDKREVRNRLAWLLAGIVIVSITVIFNLVQATQVARRVDVARDLLKETNTIAHQQCLDRDASLRVTIQRELALSKTDLPQTRTAHAESAARYQQLIKDCDALYPAQNR